MGGGGSKNLAPPPATMHTRERRMSHIETNPPPQSEKMVECPHCSRTFASDRVDRHVEVRSNAKIFTIFAPFRPFLKWALLWHYCLLSQNAILNYGLILNSIGNIGK